MAAPEMAAPGQRLCAAAALFFLLCLPLRARADEHEHTVRRAPASPECARSVTPAFLIRGPCRFRGAEVSTEAWRDETEWGAMSRGHGGSGRGRQRLLGASGRFSFREASFSTSSLLGLF